MLDDEEFELLAMAFNSMGSLVDIGRPMSAAELVLRDLPVFDRLNICGMRARDKDDELEPSGGCIC